MRRRRSPWGHAAACWHEQESEDRDEKCDGSTANTLSGQQGERLAFEGSGTRLYEALVLKDDAFGSFAGGPSKADSKRSSRKSTDILPC